MIEPLLPIGSVVKVKSEDATLMVIGFFPESGIRSYDYLGVLYPQGLLEMPNFYLFDIEQIEDVIHKGFVDIDGRAALDAAQQLMEYQTKMNQEILTTVFAYLEEHPELRSDDVRASEQTNYTLG